jgi:hypothetical protein
VLALRPDEVPVCALSVNRSQLGVLDVRNAKLRGVKLASVLERSVGMTRTLVAEDLGSAQLPRGWVESQYSLLD